MPVKNEMSMQQPGRILSARREWVYSHRAWGVAYRWGIRSPIKKPLAAARPTVVLAAESVKSIFAALPLLFSEIMTLLLGPVLALWIWI